MIPFLLRNTCKLLLSLRYRIEIRGLEEIAARGTGGIVFLPNHPALIDPVILVSCLNARFAPAVLADKEQVDRPIVRQVVKHVNVRPLLDVRKHGLDARPQIQATIQQAIDDLKAGGNLLIYPSGHTYRTRHEDLRGNSAAHFVLREAPHARFVLIRTRGLWGSGFSHAGGPPRVGSVLRRGVGQILANGIFFSPKRHVTIEFCEPADLPRDADRNQLNEYLERFYNQDAPPRTYVPYTVWERGTTMQLPEPEAPRLARSPEDVPESTRQLVLDYLRELTGFENLRNEDRLAYDLGMDSLARADLIEWLGKEFGVVDADVDSLETVGDLMLAACRDVLVARPHDLKPVPPGWFRGWEHQRLATLAGDTIAEAFLAQAARHPKQPVIADQLSGVKTYRDIILGIFALRPTIQLLEGERVGIMLPASVAADVVYLACMFAGKTPVMVNWTTGSRDLLHVLDSLGVKHVLTAGGLVSRIEAQGTDLSTIKDRLILMENVGRQLTLGRKLRALAASRLSWASLRSARISPTAAILLTSGSETRPKAVPLTHANILTNLRDVLSRVSLYHDDCLVAFLPPFHSFGLTVTMLLPLVGGLRAVYHTNPTESALLARIIEAYRASLLVGTPTFLGGIVRAAIDGQLDSLRLAVTGAEKCTPRTYEAIAERCPKAAILEGYGITECSPIVATNDDVNPVPYTIGRVLPSVESAIVNVDTWHTVGPGETGLLLVRGPTIFGGYLNPEVESPFVEFQGKLWYRTGDLVSQDAQGILTFRGRLKRFVKIAGEMISLPAIEAALEPIYVSEADQGPVLAVEATADENHPELILFTTKTADRVSVNRQLRDAGLSPIHNIGRVVQLDAIPVLGTGKTDYRALRQMLCSI